MSYLIQITAALQLALMNEPHSVEAAKDGDVLVLSLELNVHLGKPRLWTTEVFS